jgi:hypothetical protein
MNRTVTKPDVIDRILQEHNALQEKIRRLSTVLAQPVPTPEDVRTLLHEFLNSLMVHFTTEEEKKGFFEEVVANAPRLAGRAAKLCVEHRRMLHDADELCRFAAAGSPSMPWWRELRSRCHEFSKRLMVHECEENKLLQEAHQSDIGAYD